MNARTVKPRTVQLQGGPFDGRIMLATGRETIYAHGDPLPEGRVAQYRPTLDPEVYRFARIATVTERLEQVA